MNLHNVFLHRHTVILSAAKDLEHRPPIVILSAAKDLLLYR